jgi:hypothetical protein
MLAMSNPYFPSPLGSGFSKPKSPPTILGSGFPSPGSLLASALTTPRRSVFVSYHHSCDQRYYDLLSSVGSAQFQLIRDNSLRLRIDSTNHDYIIQRIRDNHITGSSCTIVLCGAETYQRKYVDWEIKATLDKGHGIVAVYLPTAQRTSTGITVPDRLVPNIQNGYAAWLSWEEFTQSAQSFKTGIEQAVQLSKSHQSQIVNAKEIKKQNG